MREELIAYLADERVGRLLRKDNGNMQFRYDDGYAGPPLSQSMPVQGEAHPHATCHAFFGGLLPEGDGRDALARALGLSPGNDYGLLSEVGSDCAGAITLRRPTSVLLRKPQLRLLDAAALDALLRALPQRPLGAAPSEGIRLSLAGAQPKLPLVIEGTAMALPLGAATPTTHILKPEPARFPGLVDNEAFCMRLARAAMLPVAEVTKAVTKTGLPYLVVTRYDRDLMSDPVRRLHQEDVCQALAIPSDRKYQSEGGPGIRDMFELLRGVAAAPAKDMPQLWGALVFNWMIGNCDAHGKNFSLLYDRRAPTLAPLYDLVSTTAYPEVTTRLAMRIDGAVEIDEVDLDAWVRLAADAGVSRRFALRTTAELVGRVQAAAREVVEDPEHRNPTARRIADRVAAIAL
jgi:serine/threonine-protein kinase HipA